ncbi:N-acetylmannosamine-6-phosphate 2-epimerase [Flavimaricola marinus]|uniref:Putative N-acetylmannosamine-6-phosphate 2-epimerase n=1 Tax=Flavimaricola marinus TaxID=1819565 RepID=A0A238LH57_9RHOB|nr:putative N-acetylmannosamine-6-phosphate 2-epimerase [Flavimaricola marinus]SMY08873.1 Putative N-acetylmannosamine-6-phosphate 2-epimerase [Flavimaricola marinus]
MSRILEDLSGALVVSCQPVVGGPLDHPEIVAAMALAALDGGARGLRIEGIANLKAVRAVTDVPIIGLVKRDLEGFEPRITPIAADVLDLAAAGADIIAIDATDRPRPDRLERLIDTIQSVGRPAMADCSTLAEGVRAVDYGVEVLGSTMSGHTGGPIPDGPDLALVSSFAKLGRFVVAEGRYHRPDQAARAIEAGANAVVVGSAITRPEHVATWFSDAIKSVRGDAS